MPTNMQKRPNEVRGPRVQISADVHTPNGMKKINLPFVVGVIADLSGKRKEQEEDQNAELSQQQKEQADDQNAELSQQRAVPLPRLEDQKRQFIRLNKGKEFNEVLKKQAPRLEIQVENKLTRGVPLTIELNFESMEDFKPGKIVQNVPVLRELYEMRKNLNLLLARMAGKPEVGKQLALVLKNTEKALAALEKPSGETPSAKE